MGKEKEVLEQEKNNIVLNFGNIVSELEEKNLKLLKIIKNFLFPNKSSPPPLAPPIPTLYRMFRSKAKVQNSNLRKELIPHGRSPERHPVHPL